MKWLMESPSDASRFRGQEWLEDSVCQPRLDSWSRTLNLAKTISGFLAEWMRIFRLPLWTNALLPWRS
jgi:hypothetical protein